MNQTFSKTTRLRIFLAIIIPVIVIIVCLERMTLGSGSGFESEDLSSENHESSLSEPHRDRNEPKVSRRTRTPSPLKRQQQWLDKLDLSQHDSSEIWTTATLPDLKYPDVIASTDDDSIHVWAGNHVIVRCNSDLDENTIDSLIEKGFRNIHPLRKGVYLIGWNPHVEILEEFCSRTEQLEEVIHGSEIEYDYVVYTMADSSEGNWWIDSIDMRQPLIEGVRADGILVSILDSGINTEHEDLRGTIQINSGESINGQDSDSNGYVDDLNGYDFVDLDNDPKDEEGHGTAMAGAIAALSSNGTGIQGIAQGAHLLNVRVMDASGTGFTSDIIRGIDYSRQAGADIINMSLGGPDYSQTMYDALEDAIQEGAIIVAASGNDGKILHRTGLHIYPACYNLNGLVAIGSYGASGISSFSNVGPEFVDWFLPGENVNLPTLDDHGYRPVDGTSVSAAIMSGLLAVFLSDHTELSASEVVEKVAITSNPVFEWKPYVQNYGRISAWQFLRDIQIQLPEIQIHVPTDETYYVGDTVQLSVEHIPNTDGNITWLVNGETKDDNISNSRSVVVPHPAEEVVFSCIFETYYARIESPPVSLNPLVGPLKITEEFNDSLEADLLMSFRLEAAVEGSPPISVQWYTGSGESLGKNADRPNTHFIQSFQPKHVGSYYFVATNGVDTLTSPLIDVTINGLEIEKSPKWLEMVEYGNGVYLSGDEYSLDGISWHPNVSTLPGEFAFLFYTNGFFFGATSEWGIVDNLYRSKSGFSWEALSLSGPQVGFKKVEPLGNLILLTDESGGKWIHDGMTNPREIIEILDPGYGGNLYFGTKDGIPSYSTDFSSWAPVLGTDTPLFDVVYSNNIWIASNPCRISWNGVQWSPLDGAQEDDQIDGLLYYNGVWITSGDSPVYEIWPDLTAHKISDSEFHFSKLSDGRHYWDGDDNDTILFAFEPEDTELSTDLLKWPESTPTSILLGDPFPISFDLDTSLIQSVQLFNQIGLVQERTDPPFYTSSHLPGLGSQSLQAVVQLSTGELMITEPWNVAITVEPVYEFQPEAFVSRYNYTFFRYEDDLNLLAKNSEGSHVEDVFNPDQPVMQFQNFEYWRVYGNSILSLASTFDTVWNYTLLEFNDQEWIPLNEFSTASHNLYLEGNRLFYIDYKEDNSVEIGEFVDGIYNSFFKSYGNVGIDAIGRNPVGFVTVLIRENEVPIALREQTDGTWILDSSYWNFSLYRDKPHPLLIREGLIVDPIQNRGWPVLDNVFSHNFHFPINNWILLSTSDQESYELIHTGGNRVSFSLEGDLSPWQDTGGELFAMEVGLNRPEQFVFYPANEIGLYPSGNSTELHPSDSGLSLDVPFLMHQFSLGSEYPVKASFDVYLIRDHLPTLESAQHIYSTDMLIKVELSETQENYISVPLPENLDPGTYSVGILLNKDGDSFVENNLANNLLWIEWTKEPLNITKDYSPVFKTLPDIYFGDSNNWFYSEFLGWINDRNYPWVFHLHHNWLFFPEGHANDFKYYYDAQLGWIYTTRQTYPFLYQVVENQWLYYLRGSTAPRWFFNTGTGTWMSSE